LILFGLIFSACENLNFCSSVPSEPVAIRLDMMHYPHLNSPFANEYFTEVNVQIGVHAIGFGGVLISTFLDSNGIRHAAFDMACPYEKESDVRVFPDSNGIFAICERCGSRFELSMGLGNVVQGPATEHLRPLNVHRQGIWLVVTQRHCRR